MFKVGNLTFCTFHEVVVYASGFGYIFDPDTPLSDHDQELACLELETMLASDGISQQEEG